MVGDYYNHYVIDDLTRSRYDYEDKMKLCLCHTYERYTTGSCFIHKTIQFTTSYSLFNGAVFDTNHKIHVVFSYFSCIHTLKTSEKLEAILALAKPLYSVAII